MSQSKPKEVRENYQLRLYPSERQAMQVKANAENLKLSEYIRSAALNKNIRSYPTIPELNRITYIEMGQIAKNINQIVKALDISTEKHIIQNIDHTNLEILLAELKSLKSQIQQIRLEVTGIVKS